MEEGIKWGPGNGIIFVVSAPSGAGKTTLCREVVKRLEGITLSISYTVREPREGEEDGKDYYFINEEEFRKLEEEGAFIESSIVHGKKYGTPLAPLIEHIKSGVDVILNIDTQGAKKIRQKIADAVFIFIFPPSKDILMERLRDRGTKKEEMELRIKNAEEEIRHAVWYDYIIINDKLEDAIEALKSIIIAERLRRERMIHRIKSMIDKD